MQLYNLVQLVRTISRFFTSVVGKQATEGSSRGKHARNIELAVEIPDILLLVIFIICIAQQSKSILLKHFENGSFDQSSAVKRQVSSVETPRVN